MNYCEECLHFLSCEKGEWPWDGCSEFQLDAEARAMFEEE